MRGGITLNLFPHLKVLIFRNAYSPPSRRHPRSFQYFGSVWHRNRSRSRTPNFTELETETEPKNQTTDYSVRFQFGSVRCSVKKRPGWHDIVEFIEVCNVPRPKSQSSVDGAAEMLSVTWLRSLWWNLHIRFKSLIWYGSTRNFWFSFSTVWFRKIIRF